MFEDRLEALKRTDLRAYRQLLERLGQIPQNESVSLCFTRAPKTGVFSAKGSHGCQWNAVCPDWSVDENTTWVLEINAETKIVVTVLLGDGPDSWRACVWYVDPEGGPVYSLDEPIPARFDRYVEWAPAMVSRFRSTARGALRDLFEPLGLTVPNFTLEGR